MTNAKIILLQWLKLYTELCRLNRVAMALEFLESMNTSFVLEIVLKNAYFYSLEACTYISNEVYDDSFS